MFVIKFEVVLLISYVAETDSAWLYSKLANLVVNGVNLATSVEPLQTFTSLSIPLIGGGASSSRL